MVSKNKCEHEWDVDATAHESDPVNEHQQCCWKCGEERTVKEMSPSYRHLVIPCSAQILGISADELEASLKDGTVLDLIKESEES